VPRQGQRAFLLAPGDARDVSLNAFDFRCSLVFS
jgi:hypothetical protein